MSAPPTWPGTRLRQERVDDDAVVLGDRPLRDGVARAATARFSDLVWDLSPAIFQRHSRTLILNFASVPERFRPATKELFFALLAGEPPPGQPRLHVVTIHGHFGKVLEFLTWADQRGVATLGALTADDLVAYQDHLHKRPGATAQWRQRQRHVVRLFWVYHARLTIDTPIGSRSIQTGWRPGKTRAVGPAREKTAPRESRRRSWDHCLDGRCGGSRSSPTTSSRPTTSGRP
jgi:hypothetical protein